GVASRMAAITLDPRAREPSIFLPPALGSLPSKLKTRPFLSLSVKPSKSPVILASDRLVGGTLPIGSALPDSLPPLDWSVTIQNDTWLPSSRMVTFQLPATLSSPACARGRRKRPTTTNADRTRMGFPFRLVGQAG